MTREPTQPLTSIPADWRAVPCEFFARSAPLVARDLLGLVLLRRIEGAWIGGAIVETEAYTEDDPASHSFRGEKPHIASMFGPPATVYVYRSYGVHWCLNISTGQKGRGEAVLIRALAATFGSQQMKKGASPRIEKIGSGPGRLCAALFIDRELDGDRVGPEEAISFWQVPETRDFALVEGPRIGISKALDKMWRFGVNSHPSLSRPFPQNAQT